MAQKLVTAAWDYLSGHNPAMSPSGNDIPALLPISEHEGDVPAPASRTPVRLKKVHDRRCPPKYPAHSTTKRSKYSGFGCSVYGWPSTGGVIIREQADLVELEYLGFNPLNMTKDRYADQDDEDKFCVSLRKIGGKWWRSEQRMIDVLVGEYQNYESLPTEEEERLVYIGWPEEGGVLVLEGDESRIPQEIGMLRMVRTMEERCRLLRDRFGATYYADPKAYRGFSVLGPIEYGISKEEIEEVS